MKDLFKKSVLVGLGAASLTRKKVQKAITPLVKEGLITRREGIKVVKRVISEGEKEKKRIESIIKSEIKKAKPLVRKMSRGAKRSIAIAKRALSKIR